MTAQPSDGTPSQDERANQSKGTIGKGEPGWADGLRQLYDSVVEEPLPDSFKDLIDKLDEAGDADSTGDADDSAHPGGHK